MGTTNHHMSISLQGMLNNFKRKKITIMSDDDGNQLSDSEARAEIARRLALGHTLMCCAGDDKCEGYDPFVKGCPGHKVE